jgi:hypothetical protein
MKIKNGGVSIKETHIYENERRKESNRETGYISKRELEVDLRRKDITQHC